MDSLNYSKRPKDVLFELVFEFFIRTSLVLSFQFKGIQRGCQEREDLLFS